MQDKLRFWSTLYEAIYHSCFDMIDYQATDPLYANISHGRSKGPRIKRVLANHPHTCLHKSPLVPRFISSCHVLQEEKLGLSLRQCKLINFAHTSLQTRPSHFLTNPHFSCRIRGNLMEPPGEMQPALGIVHHDAYLVPYQQMMVN